MASLTIGQLAKRADVGVETVRFYERKALLAEPDRRPSGYRQYDEIPDYVGSFDACIIPFHDDELTRGADPLKLYEYLAAGKPVISTAIPRSLEFSDVVDIAFGTDEFVSAIDAALSDDNGARERRIAAARPHSWNGRFKTIVDLTREHLSMELQ